MTTDECNVRASACATMAGLATCEQMSHEYLRLAAHWRAMAVREICLGPVDLLTRSRTAPAASEFPLQSLRS